MWAVFAKSGVYPADPAIRYLSVRYNAGPGSRLARRTGGIAKPGPERPFSLESPAFQPVAPSGWGPRQAI